MISIKKKPIFSRSTTTIFKLIFEKANLYLQTIELYALSHILIVIHLMVVSKLLK